MDFFFALLVLVTFVAMLVGLVKPKTLRIKWLKTRPRVFGMGMLTMLILTIIFANLIPETEENKQKRLAKEAQIKEEKRKQDLREAEQVRADAENQAKIETELAAAQKAKEQVRKVREAEEQAKTLKEAQQARAKAEAQAKIETELAAAQKAKEQAQKIREAREVREKQERQAQLEREAQQETDYIVFPFTVKQFIQRYENSRREIGVRPYHLQITKKTDYDEFQTFVLQPNENVTWFFKTTVTKKTNTIEYVEYIRTIIKDEDTGEVTKQFLTEIVAFIEAVEGPDIPDKGVGKIFSKMDLTSVLREGINTTTTTKNVVYEAAFAKTISTIIISARPR